MEKKLFFGDHKARNLAMYKVIAEKIRQNPVFFEKEAEAQAKRKAHKQPFWPDRNLEAWQHTVAQGMDATLAVLVEDSQRGKIFRQNVRAFGGPNFLTKAELDAFSLEWLKNQGVSDQYLADVRKIMDAQEEPAEKILYRPTIARRRGDYARILVIGDIHGCADELRRLLDIVRPTPADLIVTLGDYVDRGPDSKGVLETMLELHKGGNLVALRGNHDAMLVMLADGIRPRDYYYEQAKYCFDDRKAQGEITYGGIGSFWFGHNKGSATLASYGLESASTSGLDDKYREAEIQAAINALIPPSHLNFLRSTCVDALETENHIFAHAGFYEHLTVDEQPLFQLHWLKNHHSHYAGKTVVVGHTIQHHYEPYDWAGHTIFMDTGAFFLPDGTLSCADVQAGVWWNSKGEQGEFLTKEEWKEKARLQQEENEKQWAEYQARWDKYGI